jgi:hypothetical protein
MNGEDLYWRLHTLSKMLESSDRIYGDEHRDAYPTILDAMEFTRRADRQIEVLRGERDHQRARVESAVKLLTGIHTLLYPAPVKTADGRTMVFRPKDPDPHEILQELSDRIRALPDEIERAGLTKD